MNEIPQGKTVILFDGVCNFCNDYVQKIIQWDKKEQFVFASLQSEVGEKIRKYIGIEKDIDSIVYYRPGYAYYLRGDAIAEIIKDTNHWNSPMALIRFVPKPLRDFGYDYFAKNRYKWYGKKEKCMVPTPEIRKRFL
ncbi:thiol-disulfide oxidoreductase DCC family protein [Capnocytophaga sp. ARDL2]|uniref:thiol-disulfide oxidoreductase DCC family protein n=1 Tax=Capnocytophaga sp. ARDL2 TaxID=3238809 RepID=UPI0035582B90